MSVTEDRPKTGWPRGFGSVKRAQQLSRQLQPVLRDAIQTLATLEQGCQGRYRIQPGETLDKEDLLEFLDVALGGTHDQEVEIIIVAREAGKEVSRNGSQQQGRSTADVRHGEAHR